MEIALQPVLIQTQPVTVTVTRGVRRVTPATFATLEAGEIRERYTVQDIPVLLAELPSTTVYSEGGGGIGYTYATIRGFDARRVAVMVNGIPQNDPEDHNVYWLDMPDLAGSLEDIQVQRGAGSAFYGPPAIGGSINLVTKNFASDRSVRLSAGVGSYATRRYAVSVQSGLFENRYAFHGRLARILSSGYRDRAWVDFSSFFFGIARYDEAMTTQLHVYGGPVADGLAYYGIPKEDVEHRERRRVNPIARPEEMENFSQPHYELFHEWRLGPGVTLNNTLFLVQGNGFFDYDGSWAPYSYFRITPAHGFPISGDPDTQYVPGALIRAQVENTQYGWLPRLTLQDDHTSFVVGAEVRVHRSVHWGRLQWFGQLPVEIPFDFRYYQYRGAKDIGSLYAQVLTPASRCFRVMASLQYAFNRYRLFDEKFVGNDFLVPYHFWNPRVGLQYTPDDLWNLYISVGHTSREPRMKNLYDAAEASTPAAWGPVLPQFVQRPDGSVDFDEPTVKPESLLDIELGGGYTAPGVQLQANLYWMEFSNEIVRSGRVDRFGQPVTGNADRTRHTGVEVSGRLSLARRIELLANATFSRNRFIHHTDYSTGDPIRLDGNPIAGFPGVLANIRLTYRDDVLALSLASRYVGRQYTDNFAGLFTSGGGNTVDPALVVDAQLSLGCLTGDCTLTATLQVNNVFDVLYAAYGEGVFSVDGGRPQFFVGAERNLFFQIELSL
jgi:iron complex outermembrane receptor protein